MTTVATKKIPRPAEEETPVTISGTRKIVTKLYLEMDGDEVTSMLSQLGDMLYADKPYALTLLIEEVIK